MDNSLLLQIQGTLHMLCNQLQTLSGSGSGYGNLAPHAQGITHQFPAQQPGVSTTHGDSTRLRRGPGETTSYAAATNSNYYNLDQPHAIVHNVTNFPPLSLPTQNRTQPPTTHRQTSLPRTATRPSTSHTDGQSDSHRPSLLGMGPTPTLGARNDNTRTYAHSHNQVHWSGHAGTWTRGRGIHSGTHQSNTVQLWDHAADTRGNMRAPGRDLRAQGTTTRSNNPQFPQLVKTLNQGARLLHANTNWQSLPVSLDRDLTRIADSIKPPLATHEFRRNIDNLFSDFKRAIRDEVKHSNDTHLTQLSNKLPTLCSDDLPEARRIVIEQLKRDNSRISHNMAATYIQSFTRRTTTTCCSLAVSSRTLPATTVPTHNRFASLADMDTDTETDAPLAPEPDDTEFVAPAPPRPRPTRTTPRTPPTTRTASTRSEYTSSTAPPLLTSKKRPAHSPASPADHKKRTLPHSASVEDLAMTTGGTSDHDNSPPRPSVSLNDIAIVDRSLADFIPPETLEDLASLERSHTSSTPTANHSSPPPPKPHLSDNASWNKDQWQFPEIHPNCSTVLMTASNGVTFAPHTPTDWHTVAYRGARLSHLAKILSNCSIPDHIHTVIIACGLNDRAASSDTQFRNSLILLNSIFAKRSSISFRLCHLPKFHMAPADLTFATCRLNTLMDEILGESKRIIPLPKSFLAYTRSPDDWSHLNSASCYEFISHLLDHFYSLN